MTQRFTKNFKILPGFLLETQYKGNFLYLDPISGETLKVGSLYQSVGYPGSNLWYRASLPGRKDPEPTQKPVVHDASLSLDQEGFLIIKMKDGRIVDHGKTRRLVHMAKDIERFRGFMGDQINRMNREVQALLDVHLEAPAPDAPRIIHPEVFFDHYPDQYITSRLWFFGLITIVLIACFALPNYDQPLLLASGLVGAAILMFGMRIRSIKNYNKLIDAWEKKKIEFDRKQQELVKDWDEICAAGKDIDIILGMGLDSFDWPREVNACWEFEDNYTTLRLDIDLPRWDELPAQTWQVGRDSVTLERGLMPPYERRERYVRHVHSLAFLAAAAAFWSVPSLKSLQLSAFCENYVEPEPIWEYPKEEAPKRNKKKNADKTCGCAAEAAQPVNAAPQKGETAFLLSVKIERSQWAGIDFAALDRIDPISAFDKFELRRSLDEDAMILSRIEPF